MRETSCHSSRVDLFAGPGGTPMADFAVVAITSLLALTTAPTWAEETSVERANRYGSTASDALRQDSRGDVPLAAEVCTGSADSDGDGILDVDEGCATNVDSDLDGYADYLDVDDDGDGILTATEGSGDTDADFTDDHLDLDSDDDGILDAIEGDDANHDGVVDHATAGTDINGNGLDDAYDPDAGGDLKVLQDTDCDGLSDYLDFDDDGDGTLTLVEGDSDSDSDNVPDYLDPFDSDPEKLFVDDFEGGSTSAWCHVVP